MKLLAVFLLVGLALASAVPLYDDDLETELDQIIDELGDEFILYSDGGLKDRMRKGFEDFVEFIKKQDDEGKGIEELMKRAQDLYEKLNKMGVEISTKIKAMFEELKSKMVGNAPQHIDWKDWKERLRQIRDKIQNHTFDEAKIRDFIEKMLGKSEMTNQFLEMLKTNGEKGKQKIIDFINRLLGEKQDEESILYSEGGFLERLRTRFEELVEKINKKYDDGEGMDKTLMKKAEDFYEKLKDLNVKISAKIKEIFEKLKSKMDGNAPQHADWQDWKDRLRQIRDKIQNHEFDEAKIREFIEKILGKSEMTNQFLEMLKTKGEKGKQRIIDFINRILGEKQEALSEQHIEFSIFSRIRERLQNLIGKMKEDVDNGKGLRGGLLKKLTDAYEKFKNSGGELNQKFKDMLENLRGRVGQSSSVEHSFISRIKEKLEGLISRMHKDMEDGKGVRGDLMKKLTDMFEKFKGLGGELSQKFKDMLEKIRNEVDKSSPVEPQHSVKEIYEKVKKFFRDLNIELEEKFAKFGKYVKEQYHKGLDKTKTDIENVKNIAHKFVEDSRKISKDLAEEALEFFRPYKEDLGHIYGDVVDKILDILKKKD